MQRKNHILRTTHKSGFAIIMAISVLVVIGTIMALSLSLTTQAAKRTTDLYLYERAQLLSYSAKEYALLRIAQSNPCTVDRLDFNESFYDINISMRYVYTLPSPCADANDLYFGTNRADSGSVLLDITVTMDDPTVSSEPIRYFRRSIEKL